MVTLFLEAHDTVPREIVLDIDATDDPLHGHQEGRFFHGYYDCYCYLPDRERSRPDPLAPCRSLLAPLMASVGRLALRSPEPTEDPSCETRCENVLTPAPSAPAS